jgi:hypothetical protein
VASSSSPPWPPIIVCLHKLRIISCTDCPLMYRSQMPLDLNLCQGFNFSFSYTGNEGLQTARNKETTYMFSSSLRYFEKASGLSRNSFLCSSVYKKLPPKGLGSWSPMALPKLGEMYVGLRKYGTTFAAVFYMLGTIWKLHLVCCGGSLDHLGLPEFQKPHSL